MIVTCEKCSTRFELDEARIPVTGAQLRCSKCKHSFFLSHPSSEANDSVHAIAEEVAGDLAAGVPDPASDLGVEDDGLPDEEEEWQFSEEIRNIGDDEVDIDAGSDEVDVDGISFDQGFDASALSDEVETEDVDLASSFAGTADEVAAAQSVLDVDEMSSSGLELGSEPSVPVAASPAPPAPSVEAEPAVAAASAETPVEAGHDDSSFGSVDDFTSWMEDEDGAEGASPTAENGEAGSPSNAEELEDPGSWDLAPSVESGVTGRAGALPSAADSLSAALSAQGADAPTQTSYHDDLSEPSRWRLVLARVGGAVGWAAAIPCVAYIAYLAFQSEWARWEPVPQTFVAGALSAETTSVGWIETSRAGSLLVVDGVARNTGSEVLFLEGLQFSLLDENGDRVPGAAHSLGSPLPEEMLREAPLARLEQSLEMAHKGLLANPLTPGESRPFQAVVTELPEAASRLLLERPE